jgi:hypothetical protein
MGNLLIYVSSQQSSPEQIEVILDNMIELGGEDWYNVLDMDDYENIIANTGPDLPPTPEVEE